MVLSGGTDQPHMQAAAGGGWIAELILAGLSLDDNSPANTMMCSSDDPCCPFNEGMARIRSTSLQECRVGQVRPEPWPDSVG